MNDVKFKNPRFNRESTSFLSSAKAFSYGADLFVDKTLAQLLGLRVAQKNECFYCIILHANTSREIGISSAKSDNISSW
ncbi:MAG: AhpD family alkylhydroperoxidase [Maribacter sp.]|jgi:AhpD family alkylhydroperoxidase